MNQLCYRIVFNKTRGMLMAVAETVRSCGSWSPRSGAADGPAPLPMARLSWIGLAVLMVVGASMSVVPRAQAQIVADPGAPRSQQPVIVNTANGVPQVNIQTPSAAGVSRNTYSQFDVQRNGAILNNARADVQTQLGGWIQRNPNLANGTARVILNEVNSSNPSYLRGFVEVAGDRAQVIIANPAGVTCDGCGFINSARTTVTTGDVIMNGGSLDGYVVRGGRVRIEGAGLSDTQSGYTEIIARAAEINAGIWAKELHVTTGANRVNADHTQVTAMAPQDAAPAFGVDVGQLGGMYANKIFLVGTEAGVGMRNAGKIGAAIGEVVLTADGRIENSGAISAQERIRIQSAGAAGSAAHGIANTGNISAVTADVNLQSDGHIDNGGAVTAQSGIDLAGQSLRNSGSLSAAEGAVAVTTDGSTDNSGNILASSDVRINSGAASNSGSIAAASGDIKVQASGALNNTGTLAAQRNVILSARSQAGNSAPALTNAGAVSAVGGTVAITASGNVDNTGNIVARDGVQVEVSAATAGSANLANRGNISTTQGAVSLHADGSIDNGGAVTAQSAVDIVARRSATGAGPLGLNNSGTISAAAGTTSLTIAGAVDNSGKVLARDGADIRITAASGSQGIAGRYGLRNSGDLGASNGTVQVNVDGGLLNTGAVMGQQGVTVAARAASAGTVTGGQFDIDNNGSMHAANGQLQLGADGHIVNSGTIMATQSVGLVADNKGRGNGAGSELGIANSGTVSATAGTTSLLANGAIQNSGVVAAQGDVSIEAAQGGATLTNQGKIQADTGTATLKADGLLSNAGSGQITGRNLNLSAQDVENNGSIGAQANATLGSRSGFRQASTAAFAATGSMALNLAGNYSNAGQLRAASLSLSAAQIANLNTGAMQAENMIINASGTLSNAGEMSTRSLLDITAAELANTGVILGDNLTVKTGTINNAGSSALLGGGSSVSLWVSNLLYNRSNATIYSAGSMSIAANAQRDASGLVNSTAQVTNEDAIIEAGGNLDMAAVNLRNTRSGVAVTTVRTLDETYAMRIPSWWRNGGNQMYYKPDSSNFTSYEILYVNPADVLETKNIITPDGYVIGRAVIRTHADDTVFYRGVSTNWAAFGQITRGSATEGTRVVYFTEQRANISNPDKVAGGDDPRDARSDINWEPMPGYSNQYGNCTSNCVRFLTERDYTDPNSIFRRDTQRALAPQHDSLELTRNAHHTASEDQLAPGAGAVAEIRAGGNANIRIAQSLSNEFSNIVVNGALWLGGSNANITNLGQTLYRRHSFDGNFVTTGGTVTAYSMPDISEVIGTTQGAIVGNGGVSIVANNFSNTDLSAGSAANIRNDITPTTGSGQSIGGLLGNVANRPGASAPGGGALPSSGGLPTMSGFPAGALFPQNGSVPQPIRPGVLFQASSSNSYLLETRPQFTDRRTWLSSDYLLSALNVDPSTVQKRLGDGYYEQRLVREQIAQLTGKVSGSPSDDSQYQKLLSSGVSTAQAWGLRPGVELTPDQVSHLTSDIVWLVSQSVTLPDGRTENVLVPRVYLAHVEDGALQASGALVSGSNVTIQANNITNKGGMIDGRADGTGRTVLVASNDLANLGGGIRGDDIVISAGGNIRNETLTVQQNYANGQSSGSFTSLSNTAGIVAGKDLTIAAGGDIRNIGATLASGASGTKGSGDMTLSAGGDLVLDTAKTGSTLDVHHAGYTVHETSTGNTGSSVSAGANLAITAKRDVVLTAANVAIGANGEGDGQIIAGREVNIGAATNDYSVSYDHRQSRSEFQAQRETTTAQGSTISAAGGMNISAGKLGTADVKVTGSSVTAGKALNVSASGNIDVKAAEESSHYNEYSKSTSKGFLSSKTNTGRVSDDRTSVISSTLSGDTTTLRAGQDMNIIGSNVVSTSSTRLTAGNNITVAAASNTVDHAEQHNQKTSGLFGGGGLSVTLGSREIDSKNHQISQNIVGSNIGSIEGDVSIKAGNAYAQTGSNVLALQGDIDLSAKSVLIKEAQNLTNTTQDYSVKQGGLSLSLSSPVLAAAQTLQQMGSAAQQTGDARMKVLAGATAALAGKNAYDAIAKNPAQAGGVNLSISLGSSRNQNHNETSSSSVVGSTISAGGNVIINATGAGSDSDITIQGSSVKAGDNLILKADDQINLLAGRGTSEQHGKNSSSSASIGLSIGTGGLALTAGASFGRGHADGSDVSYTNTHVEAGNKLVMSSGGDTNLIGAVASGKQVIADVGGDLNIESLQDTSKLDSKQQSAGVSVSVGLTPTGPVSGSFNYSRTKINSEFASVMEQSGIKAGDGGFQITVDGNTDLKGAVIASTDKAVLEDKNRLTTGSLTQSDIQNKASYSADSVGIGVGYSTGKENAVGKDQQGNADAGGAKVPGTELPTTGKEGGFSASIPVAASASGNASSTTRSGISGGLITITDSQKQQQLTGKTAEEMIASINRDVSSERDGTNALKPIFNEQEVQAGFAIVSAMSREMGTFLNNRAADIDAKLKAAKDADALALDLDNGLSDTQRLALRDQAIGLREEAAQLNDNWGAKGTYRQISTALLAAASGNVTGSNATFINNMVINYVQQQGASYIGDLVANGTLKEGSPEHAALHGILACAGAAASGQSCGAGAAGAAVSSLLTGLFAETSADETAEQREAKRNLITSIVTGIAAASNTDAVAATNSATAAVDNNWLASQQIVQMNKELSEASTLLDKLKIQAKWAGTSMKQDALTLTGVGKGLAESGWEDVKGVSEFMMHPIDGLNGIKQVISSSEARKALGEAMYGELNAKIERMKLALDQGGDQNAEQLGKDIGALLWQVGSLVTGVSGVAKGGVELAKLGVSLGSNGMKALAGLAKFDALVAAGGVFGLDGKPLMDFRKLTTQQKGIIGEILGSRTIENLLPDAKKVGRTATVGQTGIDDLYKINKPGVDYIVVEYKFGQSVLKKTDDGMQMSDSWLRGTNTGYDRILESVGGDRIQADAINQSLKAGRVEKWVVHTDPAGGMAVWMVDPAGTIIKADSSVVSQVLGQMK
ncbi:hemagglutinin repeat-containing protein [Herbaspirillum seropedicae]|uniref:hemagglutinin repeat-containing protein n=1 Tax=Herbaspirillum seropedicae TaxID=964 RepID=UPI003FCCBFF6